MLSDMSYVCLRHQDSSQAFDGRSFLTLRHQTQVHPVRCELMLDDPHAKQKLLLLPL